MAVYFPCVIKMKLFIITIINLIERICMEMHAACAVNAAQRILI